MQRWFFERGTPLGGKRTPACREDACFAFCVLKVSMLTL